MAAKKDELAFYADRSTDSAFRTRNGHVSNMRREPSISSMEPWVLAEIATRSPNGLVYSERFLRLNSQVFRSNFQKNFRVRSPRRDLSADEAAVKSIAVAINLALEKAEAERAGLKRRMGEVTARAAIVAGNDLDDYLTRPEDISKMLNNSDTEIHRGEERLSILEQRIAHFRFLKTALHSRFRDSKC